MERSPSTRRQWLTGLLRWGALSGIATVAAVLIRRRAGGLNSRCTLQLPCERCGNLATFQLPQAVARKRR